MKIDHEEIIRVCGFQSEDDRVVREMWIEPGAILKVREVMDREGWIEPVIICDQNTYDLGIACWRNWRTMIRSAWIRRIWL